MHVIPNGLRRRDAPAEYGPPKTLYNRDVRWTRAGVFDRIFAAPAERAGVPDLLMIDAAHRRRARRSPVPAR